MGDVVAFPQRKQVLSKRELAEMYAVSTKTVERWMHAGMPFMKLNGHTVRIYAVEACAWVERRALARV